jgi:hypothetical protein
VYGSWVLGVCGWYGLLARDRGCRELCCGGRCRGSGGRSSPRSPCSPWRVLWCRVPRVVDRGRGSRRVGDPHPRLGEQNRPEPVRGRTWRRTSGADVGRRRRAQTSGADVGRGRRARTWGAGVGTWEGNVVLQPEKSPPTAGKVSTYRVSKMHGGGWESCRDCRRRRFLRTCAAGCPTPTVRVTIQPRRLALRPDPHLRRTSRSTRQRTSRGWVEQCLRGFRRRRCGVASAGCRGSAGWFRGPGR